MMKMTAAERYRLWRITCILSFTILLFASCARDNIDVIMEKELKTTTREILTFQDRPRVNALEYRWKAVEAYEQFIKANKGSKSELMAKSMEELADIYMEIEENTYLRKRGRFNHSRSRELYGEVLQLYPDRPENDGILYQLARGYMDEGDWEKSYALLERMTKEYPNSRFVHEAYFRLGEYYFEYGDRPKAIHYYRQVLKKDDFNFYDKALYKLGWALFQNRDYEEAADKFIILLQRKGVKLTPEGKEEVKDLSVVDRDMVWDTIKTLILVFDYMGGHSRIADYFKVRGVQLYEPYVYRRLGDIYLETGRFKEAADIYAAFIKTNPFHEDAPLFQSRIVDSFTRGNMLDLAYNERIKLLETYNEDGIWYKSNRRSARKRAIELIDFNKGLVKTDLLQLARYRYSSARATKKREDYSEAILWLNKFLTIFPDDPESAEMHFLLAEISFEMTEYDKAITEYEKVVLGYPASNFSAEAAYGALLSLEKLAKSSGPMGIDNPYSIRLAEKCRDFASAFPLDRRVPEVLLNGTDIFAQLGNIAAVREMAELLLQSDLASGRDKYLAQKYIAESFLKEEEYQKSEEEIRKAIRLLPKNDRKDLPLLEKALAASLYKQAEKLKSSDKILEAAEAFERVYRSVPNSDIASVALYDAGVLFEKNKEWNSAIRNYALLYQRFPESRYTYDALIQWGAIKEQLQDFEMAAQVYEKAVELAPDNKLKEDVSYQAILMYERGNILDGMYKSYSKFKNDFPESSRLIELTFRVAESRKSKKDSALARSLYERVVSLHREAGANVTLEDTMAAAKSQLILSNEKKRLFEEVKLVRPLDVNLQRKKDLLREALADYTSAAKYRISDITTESTYKMGEMLEYLRDALTGSERPAELTPDQLEEYNFLLEEQAFPFEERAITIYEGNIRRTAEAGIYDEWIRKSFERLAWLLPAKYKREEAGKRSSGDIPLSLPDDPELFNSRGIMFREKGEFRKAEDAYMKSISINPDFADPYLNLGILYDLYLDMPEKALTNYEEFIKKGGLREEVLIWIDILKKKMGAVSQ